MLAAAAGCGAMQERRWGWCAVAGGVLGAAAGAGTAGGLVNAYGHGDDGQATDAETGGAAAGGAVVGGIAGTLLGHLICDPIEEPPPPPPVAAPPPPAPPAKGVKLATVGEAHFDFDKADLKPTARDVLDGAVKTLNDHPSARVVVEGHADSVGSDAYNQRLSERRATAVKNYLVRAGIDSSRIRTEGFGESKPVASNTTAEGRSQNRRAEVIAD
jgi:OOP family OmpA-OmpF porin